MKQLTDKTFCTPKSCVNYYCYRRLTNATISKARIKNMPMADFSDECKERISPESVKALED